MPISDRVLPFRLHEIGKLKIGGKGTPRKNDQGRTWSAPKKFENENGPYFVITRTVREGDKDSGFAVDKVLMDKLKPHCDPDGMLRRIPIRFHSDIIEEIFPSRLAAYKGTSRYCVGDGENATRYEKNEVIKRECPCDLLSAETEPKCKPSGILWCTIIADGLTELGGAHAFRSTGWGTLGAIKTGLRNILQIVGTLSGPRMWLVVEHQVKKRRTGEFTKVPVVSVRMLAEDIPGAQRLVIAQAQVRARVVQIAGNPALLGLPAPADDRETPAEQAAVAAEWYPTGAVSLPIVGEAASQFDDDGDDDDDFAFDPQTGEVLGSKPPSEASGTTVPPQAAVPQAAVQSERPTQPAVPAVTSTAANTSAPAASSAPPPVAIDPATEGDPLTTNLPLGKQLAGALRQLAVARGIEGAAELKAAQKEILEEVTTEHLGGSVPWPQLTIYQANAILMVLHKMIIKREEA